jgi:hypothetical protein
MKRRMARLLMRLYPAAWRERYGEELEALVEDSRPGWRGLADIARGAVAMRLETPPSLARAGFWFGLIGLVLAVPVSVMIPAQYRSVAALEGPLNPQAVALAQQGALRRDAIAGIIDRHRLYPSDRNRLPKEDLIERFQRNTSITGLTALGNVPGRAAFRVAFAYDDPFTARAVARELMNMVVDEYARQNPSGPGVEVLDLPSLPQFPTQPNRPWILFLFTAGGAMLGGLIAMIRRDGPLRILRFVAAGAVVGAAILAGVTELQRRKTPPVFEAVVETRSGGASLPDKVWADLAAKYGFASVADLGGRLEFLPAYSQTQVRTRIVMLHEDSRVALQVLRDVVAAIPQASVLVPPAATRVRGSRIPNITLGAILGTVLALFGAAIRLGRTPSVPLKL